MERKSSMQENQKNMNFKTFKNPNYEWSTPLDLAEDFNDLKLKDAGFRLKSKYNTHHPSGGYRIPVTLKYTNDIVEISIQEDGKKGIMVFMNDDNSSKTNFQKRDLFNLGKSSFIAHEMNIASSNELNKILSKFISISKHLK